MLVSVLVVLVSQLYVEGKTKEKEKKEEEKEKKKTCFKTLIELLSIADNLKLAFLLLLWC